MNMHITNIIIQREYLNKVKKKSFLVTTFVVPVLFAALCVLPSLIMMKTREESRKIAVVDRSGIVLQQLKDGETVQYSDWSEWDPDSVKAHMSELGFDAVLVIPQMDTIRRTVSADIYSSKPLGLDMTENINSRINTAVEDYRIDAYNIAGLREMMDDVKSDVRLKTYTMDEEGNETITESGVYMIMSMILGMIIYMFIALFGGMVMSGVIEEKSSRVVEVLISSVKATELMFGKIIGIALVALTQFLLWILLTVGIIGIVGAVSGRNLLSGGDTTEMVQDMSGMSAEQIAALTDAAGGSDAASTILGTLANMPLGAIVLSFIIFFVFGYILYASVFAAIGSAVESTEDSQQLQMPVTIPLLIGFFIALYAYKAPDSALVFWGSMIPFTSPIVMTARIPFGVAGWEIALSIVLLIATCIICAWASAKIYKVGILMFGKKSTWKDLWKWFKQK